MGHENRNFIVTHKSQINTFQITQRNIFSVHPKGHLMTELPHPWLNVFYMWANLSFCLIWFWGALSDFLTRGSRGNSAFGWTESWNISTFVMQKMSNFMLILINRVFGSLLSSTRPSCSKQPPVCHHQIFHECGLGFLTTIRYTSGSRSQRIAYRTTVKER